MATKPKLEVTISDYDLQLALQGAVQTYVHTQMETRFEESLTEAIDQAIHARLAEITDKMRTAGWAVTDRYGNETGRATLASKARAVLFEKDQYRGNLGEQVLKELLERELKNDLGVALKEATARLRANIDTTIASKLKEALVGVMKKHGLSVYRDDSASLVVTLVQGKDGVKVEVVDAPGEDEGGE